MEHDGVMSSPVAQTEYAYIIQSPTALKWIYVLIGALGLIGNTFVIIVIFSSKAMRIHRTNVYIVNQCFIDATVALFLILTALTENQGWSFNPESVADILLCELWLNKIWLWSFLVSSTYNLTMLTFERYLAIVHPFWHKVHLTRGKIIVSIIIVWLIGPVYNMAYMFPSTGILDDNNCTVYSIWPTPEAQAVAGIVTICIQFFVPLIFLIVCYILIALNLRNRLKPKDEDSLNSLEMTRSGVKDVQTQNISSALKNIIRTCFIVSVCFVFCWSWNQIYYFMFHLQSPLAMDFTSVFYHFTVIMVFCNCCVNPFVYIAQYRAFQRAMKNLFCHEHRSLWSSTSSETPPKNNTTSTETPPRNKKIYSETPPQNKKIHRAT